ncbi:MAG: hypothetical protein M3Q05_02795, partial [Bacteroidota bacterium]|nr:hypothetical protein [Bacteroidota bacterium]
MLENEKNNPTGNESIQANHRVGGDSPQEILERRLAELNVRDQSIPQAYGGTPNQDLTDPMPEPLNNINENNSNQSGTTADLPESGNPAEQPVGNTPVQEPTTSEPPNGTVHFEVPPIESSVVNQADEVSGFEGDLTSSNDIAPDEPFNETISDAVEPAAFTSGDDAGQPSAEGNAGTVGSDLSTAGVIPSQEATSTQPENVNPEATNLD